MIGPALEAAIARGIVRKEAALIPGPEDLKHISLVETMIKWLKDNTLEVEKFDASLLSAVLAEVHPEASQCDINLAMVSFELRDTYWEHVSASIECFSIPDLSPMQAHGKIISLGITLTLIIVLCAVTAWAIS